MAQREEGDLPTKVMLTTTLQHWCVTGHGTLKCCPPGGSAPMPVHAIHRGGRGCTDIGWLHELGFPETCMVARPFPALYLDFWEPSLQLLLCCIKFDL